MISTMKTMLVAERAAHDPYYAATRFARRHRTQTDLLIVAGFAGMLAPVGLFVSFPALLLTMLGMGALGYALVRTRTYRRAMLLQQHILEAFIRLHWYGCDFDAELYQRARLLHFGSARDRGLVKDESWREVEATLWGMSSWARAYTSRHHRCIDKLHRDGYKLR